MAKNTNLGLGLYFNNETNSGIVNYVYNIVAALKTLPINMQPNIFLFHNKTAEIGLIKSIGYIEIKFILDQSPSNFLLRKTIGLLQKITGKKYSLLFRYKYKLDCFYPYFPFLNKNLEFINNKVEWLVDFNNMVFPNHYEDNGESMESYQKELTSKHSKIILSSNTLRVELLKYYPKFKNDVRILRFACSIPVEFIRNIDNIKHKHNINDVYFMSPNQFWEHKNQIVVLNAIKNLKTKRPELKFKVLFTGSLTVNRGKGLYANKIQQLVDDYNLSSHVIFLGLLDRSEQLTLMNYSLALIQPSLYEGWSTLVEEAKALNKYILLSDLPVHREQIKENCSFFSVSDFEKLSELMEKALVNQITVKNIDYRNNVNQYGYEIINALLN